MILWNFWCILKPANLSDAFWNNSLVTKLDTSVASSPMFHVFLMAQVKMGDCGFLSEQIDVKALIDQRGDIHHIFPKKYCKSVGSKNVECTTRLQTTSILSQKSISK